MEQMLHFLSRDKPHLISYQSLSSFYDKRSHSGLIIIVYWQWGRNHDSGGQTLVPHYRLHASDTETEIGRTSRKTARNVLWFQQECLLSNCISHDKGGLSSAGIHSLWRGLLWGSGNNWPDQVPTPIAQHLCHQNCQVTMSQIFLLSRFWFERFLELIKA